jgi:hypothetical protein
MPGKNSRPGKFRTCFDFLITKNIPYFTVGFIIFLESLGLWRCYYYFDEYAFGVECMFFTLFYLAMTYIVLWAMYKTGHEDSGYIIPHSSSKVPDSDEDEAKAAIVCSKCGLERDHSRIHHCSRCGRCVEFMDHHCGFTDNCIGKRNSRYFIQFTAWASILLIFGMIHVLFKVAT